MARLERPGGIHKLCEAMCCETCCYGLNYAPQPTTKFMYQSFTFFYPSKFLFSSVQFSRSVVFDSLRPHGLHAAHQASLSITNSWSLLKLMPIELVMPSSHLMLCHHLLLPPSIFPSIRDFSNESALHIRWPKYWSFSFNISPSNEYSGLISFRVDWLLVGSPCSPRDSQESSPTPQFKSINSSALSFIYSPTLTMKTDKSSMKALSNTKCFL